MTKRRPRPVGPVLHTGKPQGLVAFYDGQTLEHEQTNARVIVLSTSEDGQKALLFPLDEPGRAPFEANASWAVGWDDAYIEGPRLVELYEKDSDKPLWSAYVPSFAAACDLFEYYARQDGEPFELIIHSQHGSEYEHLEALGYFREPKE